MKYNVFLVIIVISLVFFVGCGNKAPNKPEKPEGPSSVVPGVPDTFSTMTTDPEGDKVRYQFGYKIEGGSELYTNWSDLIPSGIEYKTAITLTQPGKYYLRCQARDQKGKVSKWSDDIVVACGYGIQKWFFTCQHEDDYGEFNGTPALDDEGNIYIGCSMGHIHSLRPNGTERWRYPVDGEITSSIAIAPNGTIYACTREGSIYALNSNGTLKWQRNLGSGVEIVATPAIGQNSEIYICTLDDGLFAFSANGNQKWVRNYVFGLSSVAIDREHNLYVGSSEGYLFSLDTFGDMRWDEPFDAGDEIISSPAITSTGKICFGTQAVDSNFIILNPDGTVFKKISLQGPISASPVIGTDGSIYIATEEGVLYKLNSNGDIVWSIFTDGTFASSPAVVKYPQYADDVIYFRISWFMKNKKSYQKIFQDELDTLYYIKSDGTRLGACAIPPAQYSSAEFISSPMVGSDGTIYIGGGCYETEDTQGNTHYYGGVYAFSGRGKITNSSWPLFRQNKKNSGRIE